MEAMGGLDRHLERDAEVILQVGSHEFRANIDHLSSISPVFKEMLSLEFPQDEARKIRLDNVMPIPVDIFEIFLAAVNSSDLSMLTKKNVYGVRALADRFEVPDLLQRCSNFVRDAADISPWRKHGLGERWRDTELVKHATDVIKHRQRMSNQRCRQRQRDLLTSLQKEVTELKEENRKLHAQADRRNHECLHVQDAAHIRQENEKLRFENILLKMQLDSVNQQGSRLWYSDSPMWNAPGPVENSWSIADEAHGFHDAP